MHQIGRELNALESFIERVVSQAEAEYVRVQILARNRPVSSSYGLDDDYTQLEHADEVVQRARLFRDKYESIRDEWDEYRSSWMSGDIAEMEVSTDGETD